MVRSKLVAEGLISHSCRHQVLEIIIAGSFSQGPAHIHFPLPLQARADSPVGGDAYTVALMTKMLADGADETEHTHSSRYGIILRRTPSP